MRKEYTNINQASDVFYAIDNFFAYSQISSLYTLIDSRTDRRVYHNISENLDLIFYYVTETLYHNDSDNVILLVTTEYDTSKDVWFQQDLICNGINVHDAGSIKRAVYYFPAPTLIVPTTGTSQPHKLVINFNSENKTFMLSLVGAYDFISQGSVGGVYTAHRTSSICFGMVRKALDFEGGFFYGGDFVYTYEWIYGENNAGSVVANYVYTVYDSSFNSIHLHTYTSMWYNDPYSTGQVSKISEFKGVPAYIWHTNPDNVNRLDLVLRINVDNAPNRDKNNEVKPPDMDTTVTPSVPYFKTFPPLIIRNQTWATTMKLDYYVRMVCSITNLPDLLPRYTPLLSDTFLEHGRALSMVNKISLVMPLWFMVQRDPIEQDIYSYAGKNEVINFVNMRYMDTNRIKESTFPTTGEKYTYNCFQMGSRRAWFGMKGYSGLAFKIEKELIVNFSTGLVFGRSSDYADHVWNPVPMYEMDYESIVRGRYGNSRTLDKVDEFALEIEFSSLGLVVFNLDNALVQDALINKKNINLLSNVTSVWFPPTQAFHQTDYNSIEWNPISNYPILSNMELNIVAFNTHTLQNGQVVTIVGFDGNNIFNSEVITSSSVNGLLCYWHKEVK